MISEDLLHLVKLLPVQNGFYQSKRRVVVSVDKATTVKCINFKMKTACWELQ